MIHSREDLHLARRIVIKAGTSVVSNPNGFPSLSRMANIVEHAASLVMAGKEVIIVTSGAVGVGRQRLRKQSLLRQSMSELLSQKDNSLSAALSTGGKVSYNSACAAAGQLGLMSLYETMFSQFDIPTSQLLVTAFDFTSPERRRNVQHVISQLLALGVVPLLNENDAVSANQGYQLFQDSFSDNDSLAALVSIEMSAQLLILLTDVKGVYDKPPKEADAKLIDTYCREKSFVVGEKSLQGRGGMEAKVQAALKAVDGGVQACIIAAGGDFHVIEEIFKGSPGAGTLFLPEHSNYNGYFGGGGGSSSSRGGSVRSSNADLKGLGWEDSAEDAVWMDPAKQRLQEAVKATLSSQLLEELNRLSPAQRQALINEATQEIVKSTNGENESMKSKADHLEAGDEGEGLAKKQKLNSS